MPCAEPPSELQGELRCLDLVLDVQALPRWIVYNELVMTSKEYVRTTSEINPGVHVARVPFHKLDTRPDLPIWCCMIGSCSLAAVRQPHHAGAIPSWRCVSGTSVYSSELASPVQLSAAQQLEDCASSTKELQDV